VTVRVLDLLAANLLMLVLGVGLLPILRLASSRRELVTRLFLAYLVGMAATGILAADLAVVDIPVGWIVLSLLAVASLVVGLRRLPAPSGIRLALKPRDLAPLPVFVVVGAFFVIVIRLFAVEPLLESDGWSIWGLRARALYDFGHPVSPVFTSLDYPALQHPLWLPALEALDFRFMKTFDGTLVHLQLAGLAVGFVGGGWVLLRRHASPLLLAATMLAILTAPSFFGQLQTNFADVPLAMLIALGVSSLVVWLRTEEPGLLSAAVLFLGAGATTKNEGEMFALMAYVAAAIVSRRSQLRRLGLAALATLAIDLPWRLWVQLHHVKIAEYSLASLFSPSYLWKQRFRVGPSAHELLAQIWQMSSWSYLVLFVLVGFAGALALQRVRLTVFSVLWLVLSFGGLLVTYWISNNPLTNHLFFSSYRTIDTLVITGVLLVPLLLRVEPEREPPDL